MPFRRRALRPVRITTRRIVVAAMVIHRNNNNTVDVSANGKTYNNCNIIQFKDGTEGFEVEGSYFDMNRNIRNQEDLA